MAKNKKIVPKGSIVASFTVNSMLMLMTTTALAHVSISDTYGMESIRSIAGRTTLSRK